MSFEGFTVTLSFIAIIVSILAWHRSRVIYKIETIVDNTSDQKTNELLKTGKYTILNVSQDPSNKFRPVYVLGKVKK